ncbi:MAG: N-acetylmuramoyl-L-alanine amidase [Ignavibacteria bacterium]|nr:N-acetylmuramoyl-L-alanine amidase [Ignavibacteria bacterium]
MKKSILIIIVLFSYISVLSQNLSGIKIALDPGHGFVPGHAADCSDAETKRFESWINHCVVPYLKRYLQNDGATVITTRTDYDSVGPCITLSQRKTIANNANVDWFHSIHHNAYNGTTNYSLVLFKQVSTQVCPMGNPQWPGKADTMAVILAAKLYGTLSTTTGYARGDSCFLGFNLGVLSTLNMPGTLSEGSFWDYQPEIQRLRNVNYLKTEAEVLYHGFLQYFKKPLPTTHASLVGIVSNLASGKPINAVKLVIPSLGLQVYTDSLDNGFYRFDSLAPGNYTVKAISYSDTVTLNITVTAGKVNVQNFSINQLSIPSVVKIKMAAVSGTSMTVRWTKSAGSPDYYDVYLTDNSSNWQATAYQSFPGTDSSGVVSLPSAAKAYFIKMKARNGLGSSVDFSKIFAGGNFSSTDKCLIVDGFNRYTGSASYQSPYHPFIGKYGQAVAPLGISFESASNAYMLENPILNNYAYIIWILGDESTADETFSTAEQTNVANYLKQGGKLFVSGSEVAWDLDYKGSATDKDFMYKYMKAKYVADNPTPNTPAASGVAGSIFNNLGNLTFGVTYPEDYPDVIDTTGGSAYVLRYNATQAAGVSYRGVFFGGTTEGKLIYLSSALETIGDTTQFNKTIAESFDFFKGVTGVKDNPSLPKTFAVAAYPNPFNNATRVSIQIPKQAKYDVALYSMLGQRLRTIASEEMAPGLHTLPLDMSTFSSGVYFVRVTGNDVNGIVKIVLMK